MASDEPQGEDGEAIPSDNVLAGDIDAFLAASLAHKVSDKGLQPQADLD